MKHYHLIAFILVLGCSKGPNADEEHHRLPSGVTRAIEDSGVVLASDLDAEVIQYRKNSSFGNCDSLLRLNLDNTGELDLAVLTKKSNDDELTLHVFLCGSDGCERRHRQDLGQFYGLQYLQCNPKPNQTDSEISLEYEAFKYVIYGKGFVTYKFDPESLGIVAIEYGD